MLNTTRWLNDKEREDLAGLNKIIDDAIAARTAWLDAKMEELAELKPGDEIYDLETGRLVGVVQTIYRLSKTQNIFYDSFSVDYTYAESNSSGTDNTSRQSGRSFGSKESARQRAEERLAAFS